MTRDAAVYPDPDLPGIWHLQVWDDRRLVKHETFDLEKGTSTTMDNWYEDHSNLVLLTSWLADQPGASAQEVAYAVEKPWKFQDEYEQAKREVDHAGKS